MTKDKPIVVTIRIESTNFSTQLRALEYMVSQMKATCAARPADGAVIEDKYWKLTVVERQNLLNDPPREDVEAPAMVYLSDGWEHDKTGQKL
jgi:hypothetical protein